MTTSPIPADVVKLVIAARAVAYGDRNIEDIRILDDAVEAFAERVPWEGDPEAEALQKLYDDAYTEFDVIFTQTNSYPRAVEAVVNFVRKNASPGIHETGRAMLYINGKFVDNSIKSIGMTCKTLGSIECDRDLSWIAPFEGNAVIMFYSQTGYAVGEIAVGYARTGDTIGVSRAVPKVIPNLGTNVPETGTA